MVFVMKIRFDLVDKNLPVLREQTRTHGGDFLNRLGDSLVKGKLQPALLRATIAGQRCPDCGGTVSPSAVTYAGIYSPGWPLIPVTKISKSDLYQALALMEWRTDD
jgi:hypothetical protein